jgi:hypothetical protein
VLRVLIGISLERRNLMADNVEKGRVFVERREEVNLCNSIFGDSWLNELKEMDKHEILVKICNILGPCPSNFVRADEIFEPLKLEMTRFVIHHEYSRDSHIRSKLLLWLDGKTSPANLEKLNDFCNQYLK